ncbi:hypothetical protein IWX50DRAFT_332659 [Phyllosticta citricarpa]
MARRRSRRRETKAERRYHDRDAWRHAKRDKEIAGSYIWRLPLILSFCSKSWCEKSHSKSSKTNGAQKLFTSTTTICLPTYLPTYLPIYLPIYLCYYPHSCKRGSSHRRPRSPPIQTETSGSPPSLLIPFDTVCVYDGASSALSVMRILPGGTQRQKCSSMAAVFALCDWRAWGRRTALGGRASQTRPRDQRGTDRPTLSSPPSLHSFTALHLRCVHSLTSLSSRSSGITWFESFL